MLAYNETTLHEVSLTITNSVFATPNKVFDLLRQNNMEFVLAQIAVLFQDKMQCNVEPIDIQATKNKAAIAFKLPTVAYATDAPPENSKHPEMYAQSSECVYFQASIDDTNKKAKIVKVEHFEEMNVLDVVKSENSTPKAIFTLLNSSVLE